MGGVWGGGEGGGGDGGGGVATPGAGGKEEAAMAAAEMEEEGLEVEMAGDTRRVTAEARMEDEEAAQQVEVTR